MKSDLYRLDLKAFGKDVHQVEYALGHDFFSNEEMQEILDGDVSMLIDITRNGTLFELDFHFTGKVNTSCDRCLGIVTLPIDTRAHLVVKFGETHDEENEEIIIVPEKEGTLNVSWLAYEYIQLSLPMQHLHEEDDCDPEFIDVYHKYQASEFSTKDDDDTNASAEIDPRWKTLEGLIDEK